MPKTFNLSVFNHTISIRLSPDGKSGTMSSTVKGPRRFEDSSKGWSGAIDGIESLILGHACAGIDVTAPAYLAGLESALEAVANNL